MGVKNVFELKRRGGFRDFLLQNSKPVKSSSNEESFRFHLKQKLRKNWRAE